MSLPPLLQVLLAAMTPIGELRLSIPLGIYTFQLPWLPVLVVSLLGNMAPAVFLVLGLEWVSQLLMRFPNPLGRLLRWRAERLRAAHAERFQRYGAAFLVVLVAIPLPLTGAWTGSLAAWAFQIPPRVAIPFIALGVLLAGIAVTLLTLAGVQLGLLVTQ